VNEAPRYTVLCVGGPGDGRWQTVNQRSFEMAEPTPITYAETAATAAGESFTRHRYYVEAIALFGSSLHVAVCAGEFIGSREREKAILRAILQRDVAAQMGAL
jgi:hypothetical protein